MTRRYLLISGLIVVVCVCGLIYVPKWQLLDKGIADPKTRIELENKLRATLTQTLGGIFILIGLYFGWRRIAAAEKAVEVSQQGQITERFTRAIDQLGATDENGKKRLELRLGGIYALERIAKDSKDDHWQVMEVLTAYIRENAPSHPTANKKEEKREVEEEETIKSPQSTETPKPSADIQAILTVIGRRRLTYKKGEDLPLNLSNTDLRGANLVGANLMEANLREANLREVKGLTIPQLSKVKTLYKATLDSELMERIEKEYPHLLEVPKKGE